ncbi:hypothetical protein AC1031_015385 [Aphanomyces cochlioides]|nr:hypothetical protein AC1031_015385 [Aphanomyces cochlioides]
MVDSTLDELAARPRCRPTTFKQSAAAKIAKTSAMDNNLQVMDVSVETIVALQADLSAKSKELLWKTVLLTKLELTLQHADARAAESQVELDRAFVEHAKQTLLVEQLDTQLKSMTEANHAMQNELVQAQTDRKTLTERCMTLTRQVEKEQSLREQSDAECIAWRQKCSALDLERAKLIHSHQQEIIDCRRQLDNAQFELHQLACHAKTPLSAAVKAPTSSCSTQTTSHWDELEMERMMQARQQDLLTIAALNKSLSILQAQTTALEETKASLEKSWNELRDKAKTWKGLVALAFRRNEAMRKEHAHAIFERERLVESKRVFAKEYLYVTTQLQTLQETVEHANRQLEQDQVLLAESKKRCFVHHHDAP